MIDTTKTSVGRAALKRRLGRPFSTVVDIRRTQDAVRFLQSHPSLFGFTDGAVENVDRYLRSNIEVSQTGGRLKGALEGLWHFVRYPDLYRELRSGVFDTSRLARSAGDLARSLVGADAPSLLSDLGREILERIENLSRYTSASSIPEVMQADRELRGGSKADLLRVINLIGEFDALQSMAQATRSLNWSLPTLVESDRFLLEGEGIYHPFVGNAVPNPIDLSGGEPMVFLTGPNMAGKTTYLRCAALCVLLAQVGMGVPAARLRLTPVEVLLTSLNPSDNLRAGLSFFLSEVMRVRAAAEVLAEGKRAFVLFDEVFKGTNVRDALEASATVILGFAKARTSGFIFSSHLVELVESLRESPRVRFHYFDGQIVRGQAEYSYRIKVGVSDQRFGLHLLNEAEIPGLLERIGT